MSIDGRIHSIQSLGTLDGPGVRFVVFMQGCVLRCKCCHNPDTWQINAGKLYSAQQIVDRAERYREYFGKEGGITLSGGEPLLQPQFVRDVFALCRENGINTCLDTSGCVVNGAVMQALTYTDRVLLDLKYTSDDLYRCNVGCSINVVLEFLALLDEIHIPVTLRQVIIPTVNDSRVNVLKLREVASQHSCVDKIELLPFRKICQVKYDSMGIEFPFASLPESDSSLIASLYSIMNYS